MIFRAETITSSQKSYFIKTISKRTFDAFERKQLLKNAFALDLERAINNLMLSSIEKWIIIVKNNASNFNNLNNSLIDISNQSTSISSSSIMPNINNFNDIDFIEQQWTVLQNFINDLKNNSQEPQNKRNKRKKSESSENESERWNLDEINFFDSMYDGKFVIIENFIEHIGKNIYFRDVYLFIERIKNMTVIKNAKMIKNNFYTCLRDTAFAWYIEMLIDDQKRLLKYDEEINK